MTGGSLQWYPDGLSQPVLELAVLGLKLGRLYVQSRGADYCVAVPYVRQGCQKELSGPLPDPNPGL